MKRWIIRLALACSSVVGVFLICEVMIRLCATYVVGEDGPLFGDHAPARLIEHTTRGKRLIPGSRIVVRNHFVSKRDVHIAINSLGLRDDELAVPKGADELRILALGIRSPGVTTSRRTKSASRRPRHAWRALSPTARWR